MPIIKTADKQAKKKLNRGILVDREGYFIARVEWKGSRPLINKEGTRAEERRRLLSLDKSPNAENVPSDSARWDFEANDWIVPTDKMVLINEKTGVVLKRFKGFKEKLPNVPEGTAIVDDPLPVARNFKPIYDKAAQAFVRPRRVALVDPDGVVQNIVLENPNEDTPDVAVPEGWSRFDDREWLTDENDEPLGIGKTKKAKETKKAQ